MINFGGIKLAPQPIEARIREMDGVRDAVLIGQDHPDGTGDLHVFVEREDAAIDPEVQATIMPLLASRVTSYSVRFESDLAAYRDGQGAAGRAAADARA
jgi:acyl-coenzyme A synthetase/AMP-(fatty) acid ligase